MAQTLLNILGHELWVVTDPHTFEEKLLEFAATLIAYKQLEKYIHPKTLGGSTATVGTFDVWWITTCDSWGADRDYFPHTGSEVTDYFDSLILSQLSVDCRESYPLGIYPCIALTGSDWHDDDCQICDKDMSRLIRLINDGDSCPLFHITWMSLQTQSGE